MITIDITKAKEIGHGLRRAARAEEFKPLDAKATIPMYVEAVEAERQLIRDKYADMQIAVDAADTPEAIKAALGIGGN